MTPLDATFYARPATIVARELLGRLVIREFEGNLLGGRIVETEAYISDIDEASHGFRGCTPRNRSMFGPPGHAYVYRSYGIHMMLNVVTTHGGGPASAVLLRGMEPIAGAARMRLYRASAEDRALLRGPGNLCAALRIDLGLDGHDLTRSPLWLGDAGAPPEPIVCTTRVGISKSAALPWRYYLLGSPGVSRRDRLREREQTGISTRGPNPAVSEDR